LCPSLPRLDPVVKGPRDLVWDLVWGPGTRVKVPKYLARDRIVW